MSAIFGPAGNAASFPHKSSLDAPAWLAGLGLDCYEYQCGKGVNVGEQTARALGAVITYDPNYRANLWPDRDTAIRRMRKPLDMVDILKISDEELPLLADTDDLEAGTAALAEHGIRLILVTLGPNGVFYRFGGKTGTVPGVPCTVGDTNGAGDTFFGAFLSRLSRLDGPDCLTADTLEEMLAFANKAASITTSRRGAIPAMPTLEEMKTRR